jgi:NADH:ubiquinone oxidoreductase subunit 3 (subunit A)
MMQIEDRLFALFIPTLIWALLAVVLVVVMLLASWVLRPHVLQNSEKTSTYECGEEPIGPARISYPYNYFIYTVLFVVVDVMGAFLWLITASDILWVGGAETIVWQLTIFVLIIMGGVGYVLKNLPEASMDGKETLEAYRKAKAEREQEQHISGGH